MGWGEGGACIPRALGEPRWRKRGRRTEPSVAAEGHSGGQNHSPEGRAGRGGRQPRLPPPASKHSHWLSPMETRREGTRWWRSASGRTELSGDRGQLDSGHRGGTRARPPAGFSSGPLCSLAVPLWAGCLTPLCLRFLICKLVTVLVSTSQGWCED